ncbi:MAG: hypothetical protein ACK55Z_37640, partial [bacterium]
MGAHSRARPGSTDSSSSSTRRSSVGPVFVAASSMFAAPGSGVAPPASLSAVGPPPTVLGGPSLVAPLVTPPSSGAGNPFGFPPVAAGGPTPGLGSGLGSGPRSSSARSGVGTITIVTGISAIGFHVRTGAVGSVCARFGSYAIRTTPKVGFGALHRG